MKKIYRDLYVLFAAQMFFAWFSIAMAQDLSETVKVSSVIKDQSGNPISGMSVLSVETKQKVYSDKTGKFEIDASPLGTLVIGNEEYQKNTFFVVDGKIESELIVYKKSTYVFDKNIDVAHGSLPFERITGSIDRISGEELEDYPSVYLEEVLAGRLSGLRSTYGQTSPVVESFSLSSRGNGISEYFVDGIPTSIIETPSEIDEIVLSKDFATNLLYGPTATNGALLVKTRRGSPAEKFVRVMARTGVRESVFTPSMMNSAQYAEHYNQALVNDGYSPIYQQEEIEAYKSGSDPLRYPDNDYYDDLVSDMATYNHYAAQFSGGGSTVGYFTHLGFYKTNGIESVGEGRKLNRLRVKNNLVIKLNEYANVDFGIGGSLIQRTGPSMSGNDLFNSMSTLPANAFPYKINDSVFTISRQYSPNLLSRLSEESVNDDQERDVYARLGLNIDLSDIAKGLNFGAMVGLNVINTTTQTRSPRPDFAEPVYFTDIDGEEVLTLRNFSNGNADSDFLLTGDLLRRRRFSNFSLNYNNQLGKNHAITANLIQTQRVTTGSNITRDVKNLTYGLRLNYFYMNKYVLEGNAVNAGTSLLPKSTRNNTWFYNGGVGWLAHKESFLKDASWLDFLKIRISYGVSARNYAPDSESFLINLLSDKDLYGGGGAGGSFGIFGNSSGAGGNVRSYTAAAQIEWPAVSNLSLGTDFKLFDGRINGQFNYFSIGRTNELTFQSGLHPILSSNAAFMPVINYTNLTESGVDGRIAYYTKLGPLSVVVDGNIMYAKTVLDRTAAVDFPESNRTVNGMVIGTILGLEADGIFTTETEISDHAQQYFGEVKIGDIRYKDFNGDKVIDEKDFHEIGHAPRIFYGLNIRIGYKSLSLSLHGDGAAGGQYVEQLNWNRGSNLRSFHTSMEQSWPVSDDLPRLTTLGNTNNYLPSTFWLRNASYFNLRSAYLSLVISEKLVENIPGIKSAKIYLAGKNLMTFSAEKARRYAPDRSSGYSKHPVLNAIELGAEISF